MAGRIVVGVDGSEEAAAALRWAYDEAKARGATLEVVHAWTPPSPTAFPRSSPVDQETFKRLATAVLSEIVHANVGDEPGVKVVKTLVYGDPATALLEDSERAELLVVGSRGRDPVRRVLLGSVSRYCSEHAGCPVAVVPPQPRPSQPRQAQPRPADRPTAVVGS